MSARRGMNISDIGFMAVVDDVMAVLTKAGVGDAEKAEVLYIFYSLPSEGVEV